MIRLITIITMILMPIISVSTGTSDQSETAIKSRDHLDQRGNCKPECGDPPPPFAVPFVDGGRN